MDRRTFLQASVAGAASLAATRNAPRADGGGALHARRPNIVVILSDQQRWDTVSCYGEPILPDLTPNLDRMAAQGTRFERAYTCQPVCGPARAVLQTGRYATESGCFRNDVALPQHMPTIARALTEIGYGTGYIGKWHLASDGARGINHQTAPVPPEWRGGYEYWLASDVLEFTSHSYDGHVFNAGMERVEFPAGRYRADCLTDYAVEYLSSRSQDRPFFLFVSYIEPHHQNDHQHFEGPHGSKERFAGFRAPKDLAGREGDWRAEMPDYLGCISALDDGVGRIRAELHRRGLTDDTVVIYTTDHGCHFRTRNGEHKRTCHENTIRIPMIATGPGFAGGRVIPGLVSLIDVPRTILSAAGAKPLPQMRGRSLQPLVAGSAVDWREEAFIQISESQVGRCVRTPRWTYSVYAPDKKGWADMDSPQYVEQYLYDNEADAYQERNLVADATLSELRADLADRLVRHLSDAGEPPAEILLAGE